MCTTHAHNQAPSSAKVKKPIHNIQAQGMQNMNKNENRFQFFTDHTKCLHRPSTATIMSRHSHGGQSNMSQQTLKGHFLGVAFLSPKSHENKPKRPPRQSASKRVRWPFLDDFTVTQPRMGRSPYFTQAHASKTHSPLGFFLRHNLHMTFHAVASEERL